MEEDRDDNLEPEEALSYGTVSQVEENLHFGSGDLQDKKLSHESVAPQNSYQIKPSFQDIFKQVPVKEIIRSVQFSMLSGKTYDPDMAKKWTIKMANEINEKVKDVGMKRYRHIVQVIIGERKGQGVKSGCRCVWDTDIDTSCNEIFMNDTIFCAVTVFAVFLY
ncbi:dynein light chain Tctex-type protein 2B-like [Anthonomus grandis grandis]|uniref:dynein light chain Tctex-type protein 2B-like n=1 Tax=Anthonomus grandis grandis TaxID=2921223 RepID=UPI00216553DE|nr:dynein light chain Tctex-type protein 2B-like [Anthonomus grandis grandis]